MKLLIALTLIGSFAYADFSLSKNGKKIVCTADDNQTWEINKQRTTVKYTVEGESLGAQKIMNRKTDFKSFIVYRTDEGELTLGKRDLYQFAEEDQAFEIHCH